MSLAAILVFVYCLNHFRVIVNADKGLQDEGISTGVFIGEAKNSFEKSFLGGSIEAISVPMAQANAIDFSADDDLENQDYAIMEGSGVVFQNSLDSNPFAGLRRTASIYVVAQGDTPFDIAMKFNINVETILQANNLRDGDIIKPGKELIILPINGVQIKIGKNDIIAGLAKKYSGKVEEIIAFNDLQPDGGLKAGDFLIIPNGEMPLAPVMKTPKITAPSSIKSPKLAGNWLIAPATGRLWSRLHSNNGVDISAPCGTPIYAAAAGRVSLADAVGWNLGYGKYITIQHPNGVVSLYGHTSKILVELGQQVAQGQLIALMGTTGRSTGCHVHWEVRGAVNPLGTRR